VLASFLISRPARVTQLSIVPTGQPQIAAAG